MLYVLAVLASGEKVVSSFSKLKGIGRYGSEVLGGSKAFNVWRVTSTTHPTSGEATIMRTREVINGSEIKRLSVVRPQTEDEAGATTAAKKRVLAEKIASFDPTVFVPESTPKSAGFGIWRAGKNSRGIPEGTAFAIHRDSRYGEKYVVVDAAIEGDAGKLYFERAPELPADGDDAIDSPALVGTTEEHDNDE